MELGLAKKVKPRNGRGYERVATDFGKTAVFGAASGDRQLRGSVVVGNGAVEESFIEVSRGDPIAGPL